MEIEPEASITSWYYFSFQKVDVSDYPGNFSGFVLDKSFILLFQSCIFILGVVSLCSKRFHEPTASTFCRAAQKSLVHYPLVLRFFLSVSGFVRERLLPRLKRSCIYQLCVDLWRQIKCPSLLSGINIG